LTGELRDLKMRWETIRSRGDLASRTINEIVIASSSFLRN
jgi:hypothetical protein